MAAHKLLVLFYFESNDEESVRVQVESLTGIISGIHSAAHFCTVNEMVNRNRITANPKKMMKEAKFRRLRAFRFFICRN